ncbi:hypothetical protein ABPG73_004634 [Tetrahymena malaccensis]
MILEEQIPQQAQQIFDQINEQQKLMQNQPQFEEYAKQLLDNTDSKVKDKDGTKQFTKVEEPLVVQLYDNYIIEKATAPERYAVFELEKCSCSLQDYIERQSKDGEFTDEAKLIIAKQVIDCVNYIHWFNIIHRDIKPDNFLVCIDGNQPEIKLCDFGYSAQLGNSQSIEILDRVGNYSYMAPEILTKQENENKIYSKKSDSYSVGLILSLLDNYLEFKQKNFSFMNLTFNKFDQPFQNQNINVKDNSEIFKFVKLLVVWDQLNRATLFDIVESNPKKFFSNSLQMKQIKSLITLKSIEDIQKIKITSMDDLHKIKECQIVEIYLRKALYRNQK